MAPFRHISACLQSQKLQLVPLSFALVVPLTVSASHYLLPLTVHQSLSQTLIVFASLGASQPLSYAFSLPAALCIMLVVMMRSKETKTSRLVLMLIL